MNHKFVKLFCFGLISVAMTACSDDDDHNYAVGPTMDGFYFAEQPTEYVDLTRDDSSFSFSISRNTSEGEATAKIDVDADPVFHFPESVNFAAGQQIVDVPVTFNSSELDLKDYYIKLSIPENEAFVYGNTNLSLTVGLADDLRWTTLGVGYYQDGFLNTYFDLDLTSWEVEIQEHATNKGVYRLLEAYSPYGGTGNLVINCADPEGVYIEQQSLGLNLGYGDVLAFSQAGRYLDAGNPLSAIKKAGYCGTLKDGQITFPTRALIVSMTEYNNGGLSYANVYDTFLVMLPEAYEASKTPASLAKAPARASFKPAFESLESMK